MNAQKAQGVCWLQDCRRHNSRLPGDALRQAHGASIRIQAARIGSQAGSGRPSPARSWRTPTVHQARFPNPGKLQEGPFSPIATQGHCPTFSLRSANVCQKQSSLHPPATHLCRGRCYAQTASCLVSGSVVTAFPGRDDALARSRKAQALAPSKTAFTAKQSMRAAHET